MACRGWPGDRARRWLGRGRLDIRRRDRLGGLPHEYGHAPELLGWHIRQVQARL